MLTAGKSLELVLLTARSGSKNTQDWTISSQAALDALPASKAEGSTTIPSGSRAQEGSKRTASFTRSKSVEEGDIASTKARALENQWNRLVRKKLTVAGRPRKESVYDTDVWANSQAIPSQITLFQNFTAFSIAPGNTAITKQFGEFAAA